MGMFLQLRFQTSSCSEQLHLHISLNARSTILNNHMQLLKLSNKAHLRLTALWKSSNCLGVAVIPPPLFCVGILLRATSTHRLTACKQRIIIMTVQRSVNYISNEQLCQVTSIFFEWYKWRLTNLQFYYYPNCNQDNCDELVYMEGYSYFHSYNNKTNK